MIIYSKIQYLNKAMEILKKRYLNKKTETKNDKLECRPSCKNKFTI